MADHDVLWGVNATGGTPARHKRVDTEWSLGDRLMDGDGNFLLTSGALGLTQIDAAGMSTWMSFAPWSLGTTILRLAYTRPVGARFLVVNGAQHIYNGAPAPSIANYTTLINITTKRSWCFGGTIDEYSWGGYYASPAAGTYHGPPSLPAITIVPPYNVYPAPPGGPGVYATYDAPLLNFSFIQYMYSNDGFGWHGPVSLSIHAYS